MGERFENIPGENIQEFSGRNIRECLGILGDFLEKMTKGKCLEDCLGDYPEDLAGDVLGEMYGGER